MSIFYERNMAAVVTATAVAVITAVALASGCGAAPVRTRGGAAPQHAAPAREWVAGTVEDDGCASEPCPYARPPMPVRARVTVRSIRRTSPRGGPVRSLTPSSDGQGRFRLRVRAGRYVVRAYPRDSRLRCRA